MKRLSLPIAKIGHGLRESYIPKLFLEKNHIWIASFPRSGNGWMRKMLYSAIFNKDPGNLIFGEWEPYFPDIHVSWRKIISGDIKQTNIQGIKTHFPYQSYYNKVIYLYRNPFDSIYSYWEIQKESLKQKTSLDWFVENESSTGSLCGRWDQHILSYFNSGLSQNSILNLKYEDVIQSPVESLSRALAFMNVSVPESCIVKTVEKSIIKKLSLYNMEIPNKLDDKVKLIGSIQSGKSRKRLSDHQKELIKSSQLGILGKKLGYEYDNE